MPAYQVVGDAFFNLSPPSRLSLTDLGSISLVDGAFGSVSAAAFGTPSPFQVASADISPSIFGRGDVILTYSFEIVGPTGAVPVLIDVAGGVSGFAAQGDRFASFAVESRWNLFDPALPFVSLAGDDLRSGSLSGTFSQSFSRTVSLMLTANHVYSVFMLADAGAAAGSTGARARADAFVDPRFSLGPGADPQSYSFSISAGIGNSVPEPNRLALLSAGLLSCALLRRRPTLWA